MILLMRDITKTNINLKHRITTNLFLYWGDKLNYTLHDFLSLLIISAFINMLIKLKIYIDARIRLQLLHKEI